MGKAQVTGKGRSRQAKVEKWPVGVPRPVDIHVGSRLRLRRTLMGMSQEKLGEAVGLTFQQIQKYERGANRVGASRLFEFSRILDVPVSFFFDDMPDEVATGQVGPEIVIDGQGQAPDKDAMTQRETLELVRGYYAINDSSVRRRIYDLVKSLSGGEMEELEEYTH